MGEVTCSEGVAKGEGLEDTLQSDPERVEEAQEGGKGRTLIRLGRGLMRPLVVVVGRILERQ